MNKFQKDLLREARRNYSFLRRERFEVRGLSPVINQSGQLSDWQPKSVKFNLRNTIKRGLRGFALCFGCKSLPRARRVFDKYVALLHLSNVSVQGLDFDSDYYFTNFYDRNVNDPFYKILHEIEYGIIHRNLLRVATRMKIKVEASDDDLDIRIKIMKALNASLKAEQERSFRMVNVLFDMKKSNESGEMNRRQLRALGFVA